MQTIAKHHDMFRKMKTLNIGWKYLSLIHLLEISTRQDSCNTKDHYEPSKLICLSVFEPSKLQLATDITEPFLFLAY